MFLFPFIIMPHPFLDKGFWATFGVCGLIGLALWVRLCQVLDAGQAKVSYL